MSALLGCRTQSDVNHEQQQTTNFYTQQHALAAVEKAEQRETIIQSHTGTITY